LKQQLIDGKLLLNHVRTNRIPNGELKQALGFIIKAIAGSPNEQNSEWGIET